MKKISLTLLTAIIICLSLTVTAFADDVKTVTTKQGNMTIQNVIYETTKDTHVLDDPSLNYTSRYQSPIYWIPFTQTAWVTFNGAYDGDTFTLLLPKADGDNIVMDSQTLELPFSDNSFTLQVWLGEGNNRSEAHYITEYLPCIEYKGEYIRIGFLKAGDTKPDIPLIEEVAAPAETPEPEAENNPFTLSTGEIEALIVESPSTWAIAQVSAAINANIVPKDLQSGYTQAITRAEFCALAVALFESIEGKEIGYRIQFIDTSDTNVEKMGAIGVVAGLGDSIFAPDQKITREQAASMLSRLASALGKPMDSQDPTFADNDAVSPWAVDAVGQVQGADIMSGVGDNTFDPLADYTREQSIVTMLRLLDFVK